MANSRIYLSPPYISDQDISSVTSTMKGGWVSTEGPELQLFEKKLADYLGGGYVLCLNSGTAALHLAVKLAGIKQGDHVLIGTFTFIAAANAVLYEGGEPIFIDSEPETWNIDPKLLRKYLEGCAEAEIPKAVIVTHIFGKPAKMKELREVCDHYGVKIIEDAAEAMGSKYEAKPVGGWGDYGILSFNGNKILTTGGGGALVCKNEEDYKKALFWSRQSKETSMAYSHAEVGYNYRMSNVLAGIGLSQLARLDHLLERKIQIASRYQRELNDFAFEFPCLKETVQPNYWLTVVLLKQSENYVPTKLVEGLERENIEAKLFWKPLHQQPLFSGNKYLTEFLVADKLFKHGLCLPSGIGMTEAEQKRVIQVLNQLVGKK